MSVAGGLLLVTFDKSLLGAAAPITARRHTDRAIRVVGVAAVPSGQIQKGGRTWKRPWQPRRARRLGSLHETADPAATDRYDTARYLWSGRAAAVRQQADRTPRLTAAEPPHVPPAGSCAPSCRVGRTGTGHAGGSPAALPPATPGAEHSPRQWGRVQRELEFSGSRSRLGAS